VVSVRPENLGCNLQLETSPLHLSSRSRRRKKKKKAGTPNMRQSSYKTKLFLSFLRPNRSPFVARFAKAVSDSGLDPVDLAAPRLEADAVEADFDMGELPDENDKDIPQDTMSRFRLMGGSLTELFDACVVGKLAPTTCIGVIVGLTFLARIVQVRTVRRREGRMCAIVSDYFVSYPSSYTRDMAVYGIYAIYSGYAVDIRGYDGYELEIYIM
jgi:hypothetical protein